MPFSIWRYQKKIKKVVPTIPGKKIIFSDMHQLPFSHKENKNIEYTVKTHSEYSHKNNKIHYRYIALN